MREVNEDKFCTIRDREDKLFCTKYCPFHHYILEFSEEDFVYSFRALWPGNFEDDVKELQKITLDENKNRKEKHLRPIRHVTKSEFIIFNTLTIGSSIFVQSGQNLWNTYEAKNKKIRFKLSANVDFGTYIKLWRFKELHALVPKIMEDNILKEEGDDWWQFKSQMNSINNSRKIFTCII